MSLLFELIFKIRTTSYLDWINLMTYDLHGAWDNFLAHQTAYTSRPDENEYQAKLNVLWAVDYWISMGAPPQKIMLGLALYGRSFTLASPSQTNLGDPANGPSSADTVI
jgi:chitinase